MRDMRKEGFPNARSFNGPEAVFLDNILRCIREVEHLYASAVCLGISRDAGDLKSIKEKLYGLSEKIGENINKEADREAA